LDLRKKRNLQASQHLSVILLGFFVYLFILLTLDRAFIQPISVEIGSAAVDASEIQGGAVPIDEIPVNEYRMLFFHSVVVQAIGNGVIAGKIGDDKVLSGLKYSIAFLIIGTLAFVFLV
jgi:flagellar protein FlaJ